MKNNIPFWISSALVLGISAVSLHAAPQSFDFKDPKGVNNVQFKLDAPLESISGTATGINGTVSFDRTAPEQTTGRIVVESSSLLVGNPIMRDHLHGEQWLNVAQHPTITFEVIHVRNARTEGNTIVADVDGQLTVKGVTKDLTVPVSFTHLADRLGARLNDPSIKGDLLVLRADFTINRSDFGIQPGQNTDKVSETIQLSMAVAGASPEA